MRNAPAGISPTDLGAALRAARAARGLSLRATAREVGSSDASLCRIEQGRARPPGSVAARLVDVLGLGDDITEELIASAAPDRDGLSLRKTAGWFIRRYEVESGKPEDDENAKRLLRPWLERWHREGADWIEIWGSGAGKRFAIQSLEQLERSLGELPSCLRDGCARPGLRSDGACGFCGFGRTGRPREVEWRLQRCAGCGVEQVAPIYGRQRHWWCDACNGRQKHEPQERFCERCGKPIGIVPGHVIANGGGRFCSRSCAEEATWRARTDDKRERILAPAREALEDVRAKAHAAMSDPDVLTIPKVGERLFVSPWTPYRWLHNGLLPATGPRYGRLVTLTEDDFRSLVRSLKRARPRALLDADYARRLLVKRVAMSSHGDQTYADYLIRQRVRQRRRVILNGRPERSEPPAHHLEWVAAFLDQREYYERRATDPKEPMPAERALCLIVARDDFAAHPERWDYDPDRAPHSAANRIAKAIKPLLIAATETL